MPTENVFYVRNEWDKLVEAMIGLEDETVASDTCPK